MHYFLNIIQTLKRLDQWCLEKINGDWTNPVFDIIFPVIRQSEFWMPWYLFLFVMVIANFKKKWWWWIILFLCTVALTDMTGTRLFKHMIERARPCRDPEFFMMVRMILKDCTPGSSFISNHAANHFGLAIFTFLTLKPFFGKKLRWIFVWPVLVCYSQLYVGVHYPSDIIAGAIVGCLLGAATAFIFNKRFGFANFDSQPTVTSEWK